MKTPVRSSRGRLIYTGRFSRESFALWTASPDGCAALDRLAAQTRFALFGRKRAADRRLWREINDAARAGAVAAAIQRELDAYLLRLDPLVYADALPAVTVDLRRLIVVPRVMVCGEAYRRMHTELYAQPAFAGLSGGKSIRRWFVLTVLESLFASVVRARPSIRHPLPAGDEWVVVGVNERYEWQKPLNDLAWPGHYIVLELRRTPMTRSIRHAVNDAIEKMEAMLPSLSSLDRTQLLKRASVSLERLSRPKQMHVRLSRPA